MTRVLIVDDHPVVIGGLAASLGGVAGIQVVANAMSKAEARRILEDVAIDVALVDVRLPDGSGLELIGDHGASGPAWIVLSSFEAPQYVAAALRRGAVGYLLKTAPIDEIVKAIHDAIDGKRVFGSGQIESLWTVPNLTARERDVVRGVCAGRSNDEIGMDLGISRKTVEAKLTRLFDRVGVASRTELALRAEREAWLEVSDTRT